jgi:hypothetical protein
MFASSLYILNVFLLSCYIFIKSIRLFIHKLLNTVQRGSTDELPDMNPLSSAEQKGHVPERNTPLAAILAGLTMMVLITAIAMVVAIVIVLLQSR